MIHLKFRELKQYIPKLLPQTYYDHPSIIGIIKTWTLIGLILRFIFIPIAFHGDLLSTYHRSFMILLGSTNLGLYSPTQLIQTLFLFVYQLFLPLEELLIWSEGSSSVPVAFWLYSFVPHYASKFAVFLFKIPYLIFDFATGIILLHYLSNVKKGVLAYKFWMVNPIGIFASYIFARYEMIPIFFIMLSLYFAKINKPYYSVFVLGMAIWDRSYPLLFLPFYILSLGVTIKKRVTLSILAIIPAITPFLLSRILLSHDGISQYQGKLFFETFFINFFLGMHWDIGYGQTVYIFVASYFILLLYYSFRLKNIDHEHIWQFSLMALLLYYATCMFHPQFFTWFTPFIALAIVNYRNFLKLHILQIFCFAIYTFYWKESLSWWLFASVNPSILLNLISPRDLIDIISGSRALMFINIFRSILSSISIFMIALLLYKDKIANNV